MAAERVGKAVRRLREEKGLSRRRLGELANLSPVQIKRIEGLEASPTEDSIRKLAAALQVSVVTLFGYPNPVGWESPYRDAIMRKFTKVE